MKNNAATPALLYRPRPLEQEGLNGYLLRLAEGNGLRGVAQLWPTRTRSLELLFLRLGIHKDSAPDLKLSRLVPQLTVEKTQRPVWNHHHSRFCAACLDDSPVWKLEWELTLSTACPTHRLELADRCGQCGALQKWSRQFLTRCKCGALLSTADQKEASELEIGIAELIRRKAQAAPLGDEHLEQLSLEQMHRLVFMLGAYSANDGKKFSQKISNLADIAVARPLVVAAGAILDKWPNGFFSLLDQLRKAREIDIASPSLAKRFGFFYKYIYTQLTGPEFSFLHQTFEQYVERHWKGSLAARNTRLSADLRRRHAWLPIGVAAKYLRISNRRLLQLMSEHGIEGSSMFTEARREMVCVSRTDIAKIQTVLGELVDLSTACDMLGLKKRRMLQLLEAGTLTAVFKPKVSNSAKWGIRKALIDALLILCNALPDDRESREEKLLSLNSALRFQMAEAHLLPALIVGIGKNEIFPLARDVRFRGITGMLFEQDALLAWIRQQRHGDREDAVSIPEAARRLNVKQEAMYSLVARGIFKISDYSSRLTPLITTAQLERFHEEFILGREIRERTGLLPNHASRRLAKFGVLPVSGKTADSGKVNVYRRESVPDSLLAKIASPNYVDAK